MIEYSGKPTFGGNSGDEYVEGEAEDEEDEEEEEEEDEMEQEIDYYSVVEIQQNIDEQ